MKMVKSLLLGTAAGLVAMTGAQAADLPVKAKPVQYVKICSLYGAGFYYIPGTDMCLKMGGWVRAEYAVGYNGTLASGPYVTNNVNNRTTNDSVWRARGYITADARNQSEYGTIRSYIAVGISTNNVGADTAANTFSANRAFIQLAGFTFGLTQSFYDFYSGPATGFMGNIPMSDTGDGGWMVGAYTAQFGGGLSATLSAEMARRNAIFNEGSPLPGVLINSGATLPSTTVANSYGGFAAPDVVANLRIDQAWGSAQVMGALHQVNANYYGTAPLEGNGHPGDKWGFALGAGLKLLAPMIAPGDYLQTQVNYTQGASKYTNAISNGSYSMYHGNNYGFGVLTDAVYGGSPAGGGPTDLQLTTSWNVNAAYEHFWNKQWRTSIWGDYEHVSYNGSANAMLCTAEGMGTSGVGIFALAAAGCDNNWSFWAVGSRTQWNVTPDTYLGLEVAYQSLKSAATPTGSIGLAANGTKPAGAYTVSDQNNWTARFRVHKDFYP